MAAGTAVAVRFKLTLCRQKNDIQHRMCCPEFLFPRSRHNEWKATKQEGVSELLTRAYLSVSEKEEGDGRT